MPQQAAAANRRPAVRFGYAVSSPASGPLRRVVRLREVPMKYVVAYCLAIVLARFCFWFGSVIVSFPVAGCLARASEQLRGVVAGVFSGLGGVAASFAFGYFVFCFILGSSAFGLFPLLAATVPLVVPIRKDLAQSRLLSDDVNKFRHLLQSQPGTAQEKESAFTKLAPVAMAIGCKFRVIGAVLGLVLAFLWLFFLHENAA